MQNGKFKPSECVTSKKLKLLICFHIHINCAVLLTGLKKITTGVSYYDFFESKSVNTKIFVMIIHRHNTENSSTTTTATMKTSTRNQ